MKNINWDDIIAEWSYRLPKGFPTMKNGKFTVKSELKVLQEVLAENGINEMPDFTKKVPAPVREAERTDTTFSKDELINIIKTTQLSEKDLVRITRIVDSVSSEEGIIQKLSTEKNFDNYKLFNSCWFPIILSFIFVISLLQIKKTSPFLYFQF